MLKFELDVRFMLLIIEMISDLHLCGKLVSRPVKATSPKYLERCFSSKTKSNIGCNAEIWAGR